MVNAQKKFYNNLIIKEVRLNKPDYNYCEVTNMGTEPIDLFEFKLCAVRETPWVVYENSCFIYLKVMLARGKSYVMATALDAEGISWALDTRGSNSVRSALGFRQWIQPKEMNKVANYLFHMPEAGLPAVYSSEWISPGMRVPCLAAGRHENAQIFNLLTQLFSVKKTSIILLSILLLSVSFISGQVKEKEKIKKGLSFGFFPAFGYDSNTGAKYGGILKLFDYGDGSSYPGYNQSFHFEWSQTTKGSGVTQLIYDTRKLIPGIRTMAEAAYLSEKVLDFYGFNGYNAYYNSGITTKNDPLYRSTVFYRMERAMVKLRLEFIGKLKGDNLKWFGGFEYMNNKLDTVDINNLNKDRDQAHYLPSIGGGLYGDFIKWGLIPQDQAHGGHTGIFKVGAKYDTRDNEPNPMTGLWTEAQLLLVPGFLSEGYGYTRFTFTHRQYFTLIPKKVNLVYRLSYQANLSGTMPFYMLPLVFNSAPQVTLSGLGGARSMRGILRNRVVGKDFAYGNAEIRWKVLRTIILDQNFYVALSGFADVGMVTGKYKLPEITDPQGIAWLAKGEKEKPHLSYGGGAHFAINDNFVIAMEYGWAADPRDGNRGTYIGLNFLF